MLQFMLYIYSIIKTKAMTTQIENPVKLTEQAEQNSDIFHELNFVISELNFSKSIARAKRVLGNGTNSFKCGYGSSHVWIKQLINGEVQSERILIAFE